MCEVTIFSKPKFEDGGEEMVVEKKKKKSVKEVKTKKVEKKERLLRLLLDKDVFVNGRLSCLLKDTSIGFLH